MCSELARSHARSKSSGGEEAEGGGGRGKAAEEYEGDGRRAEDGGSRRRTKGEDGDQDGGRRTEDGRLTERINHLVNPPDLDLLVGKLRHPLGVALAVQLNSTRKLSTNAWALTFGLLQIGVASAVENPWRTVASKSHAVQSITTAGARTLLSGDIKGGVWTSLSASEELMEGGR